LIARLFTLFAPLLLVGLRCGYVALRFAVGLRLRYTVGLVPLHTLAFAVGLLLRCVLRFVGSRLVLFDLLRLRLVCCLVIWVDVAVTFRYIVVIVVVCCYLVVVIVCYFIYCC